MSSFREQLTAAARIDNIQNARVIQLLSRGRCPASALKSFATHLYHGAAAFPCQLVKLVKLADNPKAKLYLLDNLLEESGVSLNSKKGMVYNEQARHTSWAMTLARALGVEEDLSKAPIDTYTDIPFESYLESGDWLSACAYLLVGKEYNVPETFEPIYRGLLAQGYDKSDLVFLYAHIEIDRKHGDHGIELLYEVTPAERRKDIVAAVENGRNNWHDIFNKSLTRQI